MGNCFKYVAKKIPEGGGSTNFKVNEINNNAVEEAVENFGIEEDSMCLDIIRKLPTMNGSPRLIETINYCIKEGLCIAGETFSQRQQNLKRNFLSDSSSREALLYNASTKTQRSGIEPSGKELNSATYSDQEGGSVENFHLNVQQPPKPKGNKDKISFKYKIKEENNTVKESKEETGGLEAEEPEKDLIMEKRLSLVEAKVVELIPAEPTKKVDRDDEFKFSHISKEVERIKAAAVEYEERKKQWLSDYEEKIGKPSGSQTSVQSLNMGMVAKKPEIKNTTNQHKKTVSPKAFEENIAKKDIKIVINQDSSKEQKNVKDQRINSLTNSVQERKAPYIIEKGNAERQHSLVSLIENLNGGGYGSGSENTYNPNEHKKIIVKTLSGISDSKDSLPQTGTQKSALKKSAKGGKGKGRKSVKFDGGPKTNFQKKNFI